MFREMRRKKQELSKEECIDILQTAKTAVLGVVGDDGYPYTVPINFVYANDKIYFHGAKNGHKIDAINKCNKVSLCVVDKDDFVEEELTTYFKSVILFGKARILNTDKEIFHAAKVFGLKYNNDVTAVEKEIRLYNKSCGIEKRAQQLPILYNGIITQPFRRNLLCSILIIHKIF